MMWILIAIFTATTPNTLTTVTNLHSREECEQVRTQFLQLPVAPSHSICVEDIFNGTNVSQTR